MPSVVLSVVSGADPALIRAFLRSVDATIDGASFDLRVIATVDRNDADLAREVAEVATRVKVDVVENDRPLGFAANHNRAMTAARDADYFLIANDDVIVEHGAIDELLRFACDPVNARVAVVSPQLLNEDGSLQPSTYSFPSGLRMLLSLSGLRSTALAAFALRVAARIVPRFRDGGSKYWAHDAVKIVDTVRGAFVLVRAAAVADVGLMDEVSLAGGEETEWHKRMSERGWQVAFDPCARVVHLGGRTVGADRRIQLEYLRGWLNYFKKHTAPWRYAVIRAGAAALFGGRWIIATLGHRPDARRLAADGIRIAVDAR